MLKPFKNNYKRSLGNSLYERTGLLELKFINKNLFWWQHLEIISGFLYLVTLLVLDITMFSLDVILISRGGLTVWCFLNIFGF